VSTAVRLVATDLDGTLFGPGEVVTARTRAAIAATVSAGIPLVVATGRSEWTAEPLLQGVEGLDLVVCSNGASRYSLAEGRSLVEHPIAPEVVDEVLLGLEAALPGCVFGWETSTGLHYEEAFIVHRPSRAELRPASPPLQPGWREAPIRKLLVAHPELIAHDLLEGLTPHLPDRCIGSCSGARFVEVTGEGVDKAFGVRAVCAELGVDWSEVLAFGDNENDVALLRWAGRSVAMGNARPEVVAAADEVTAGHDADGVAVVLEGLLAT
jgi:Cof subfamily protein (haloacid dehalogenase superfamily)